MTKTKHIVLGAGITGLSAARELAKNFGEEVVLLEKQPFVGGLAASIQHQGFSFDLGSHRIHPQTDPKLLEFLRQLIDGELLKQRRNGVIFVDGRFIRYPPSVLDIASGFGIVRTARFFLGILSASARRCLSPKELHTFEAYARAYVGRGLYQVFYRPYATKLWGLPPDRISDEPARKRVRKKIGKELMRAFRFKHSPHFYYPAQGIGQIAESLKRDFVQYGGRLLLDCTPEKLRVDSNKRISSISLRHSDGSSEELAVETVLSTLPIPALYELLQNTPLGDPNHELKLRWRALRVLFLITPDRLPDAVETFYFPGSQVFMGRVSEIGKYSPALLHEEGYQLLTIEIPCSKGDDVWNMDDQLLKEKCIAELCRFGILREKLSEEDPRGFSVHIENVYPLYALGWRDEYERVLKFQSLFENLYVAGRSALFMHCNLDHCISMGEGAASFLKQENSSEMDWQEMMRGFSDYYVRE